jgi:hypothetical protein
MIFDCGHWLLLQFLFFFGPREVATHFWNSLALQAFELFQWYRLLTALQNDDKRRVVQLSLTGC